MLIAALLLMPVQVMAAAGGSGFMLHAGNDVGNKASLQRGARNYVNYCLGCHSLQYVRYNQVAKDLGIAESDLEDTLMWTAEKPQEVIEIAMPDGDAARWFGRTPPDLSLTSRRRGTDWIYSYLKAFYVDPTTMFGYNNLVLENAAMPHVLWSLEGDKAAIFEDTVDQDGVSHTEFKGFEQLTEGKLSEAEYDEFVIDLVNFLDYVGEPVQLQRQSLGIKVIAYLLVFLLLAMALKKEFWKDVD
ncbi:MAG: cytochrome c1 [Gammaproteobacteria bacterium]|nr:cytochrome c1 [Gammaproteobacteria bacterium]